MTLNLKLASGDLIFLSIPTPLYRKVAAATGSPASHVGIVFRKDSQRWMVAESTIPFAKYTPLDQFLARSDQGWFAVRRLKGGLSGEQVHALREECDQRMGKLYHLGFRYDSKRQFCSKLVYDAYKAALGIEVGSLQPFGELLHQRPSVSLWFWRLWFLGRIPWSRRTVTPASQLQSPLLETITTSANEGAPAQAPVTASAAARYQQFVPQRGLALRAGERAVQLTAARRGLARTTVSNNS